MSKMQKIDAKCISVPPNKKLLCDSLGVGWAFTLPSETRTKRSPWTDCAARLWFLGCDCVWEFWQQIIAPSNRIIEIKALLHFIDWFRHSNRALWLSRRSMRGICAVIEMASGIIIRIMLSHSKHTPIKGMLARLPRWPLGQTTIPSFGCGD